MSDNPANVKTIMAIKIRIPSPLRSYTNGIDIIEAEGASVGDVLNDLKTKAAGIETRLFKGPNQLNRFVNIYVNDEDIRFLKNLETPVKTGDEISIVPAIAGGSPGVSVRVGGPFRGCIGGKDRVDTNGSTVADVLRSMGSAMESKLFVAPDRLNRAVNIFLNDEDIRFISGLGSAVKSGDEISIVPAVAGG
jgi:molybdopterin synthase sulfur carrier subunit